MISVREAFGHAAASLETNRHPQVGVAALNLLHLERADAAAAGVADSWDHGWRMSLDAAVATAMDRGLTS